MQDMFNCYICGKPFYSVCVMDWCYRKNLNNKFVYACSWTCFNKIEVRKSRNKPYENEQIKKELEGNYGPAITNKKHRDWELEELENKRRDIENDMKKKGAWIQ